MLHPFNMIPKIPRFRIISRIPSIRFSLILFLALDDIMMQRPPTSRDRYPERTFYHVALLPNSHATISRTEVVREQILLVEGQLDERFDVTVILLRIVDDAIREPLAATLGRPFQQAGGAVCPPLDAKRANSVIAIKRAQELDQGLRSAHFEILIRIQKSHPRMPPSPSTDTAVVNRPLHILTSTLGGAKICVRDGRAWDAVIEGGEGR